MTHYEIKKIPEDFQVIEANDFTISSAPKERCSHHYYYLTKLGFTTFEAINNISQHIQLSSDDIGYSGLKDEDGVTAQYFSSPVYLDEDCINKYNNVFKNENQEYITIKYVGSGDVPFKVAKLKGNNFQLKIRNLSEATCLALSRQKEYHLAFINYYGSQRFGLPGQIKNTHLIGKAVLEKNYQVAIAELSKQNSEHGKAAKLGHADASSFFQAFEKRMLAFFQSAHFSYLWNHNIIEQVIKIQADCVYKELDGIEYPLLGNDEAYVELLENCSKIVNTRMIVEAGEFKPVIHKRNVVIQTTVQVGPIATDELNKGKYSCQVAFYLPSGCYATIAIPQFMQRFLVVSKKKSYAEL